MESFSQRKGIEPIKSKIQSESIDDALRTALWNLLQIAYFEKLWNTFEALHNDQLCTLCKRIWVSHFNRPLDEFDINNLHDEIKGYFFQCEWYEVYDFIEFVISSYPEDWENEQFMEWCNDLLKNHLSAYRFINGMIWYCENIGFTLVR